MPLPVSPFNSNSQNWNTVNNALRRLEYEQVTKAFKQPGGNSVITGKLPYDGGYGILIYDSNNVPNILIGSAPDDGRMGIWKAEDGENVLDLLGG